MMQCTFGSEPAKATLRVLYAMNALASDKNIAVVDREKFKGCSGHNGGSIVKFARKSTNRITTSLCGFAKMNPMSPRRSLAEKFAVCSCIRMTLLFPKSLALIYLTWILIANWDGRPSLPQKSWTSIQSTASTILPNVIPRKCLAAILLGCRMLFI
jgi:hypothetical protein